MALVEIITEHLVLATSILVLSFCFSYVSYQRYFHPLAKYPGPFLASLTDLWQVCQFLSLKQPYNLTELHAKYGTFVRYGPDKISVTEEDAVSLIYQKGGRSFPKTEFYDAYGAAHPNVFGMRDEAAHSLRRRYMSNCFSITYMKQLEPYLDLNMGLLRRKIREYCDTRQAFDLKEIIHFYVIDVLGELAFGQSFGVQLAHDKALAPPVVEHSLLAAVTGAWPAMTFTLKKWLPLVPHTPLRNLFQGRARVAQIASESVQRRLEETIMMEKSGHDQKSARRDILSDLIAARNADTGARLSQADLETEAFGYIIAGTHTTSATTTLLFYHLLHSPTNLRRLVSELDNSLLELQPQDKAYAFSVLESQLPFTRNCIKENFRLTPVFTMPLARRVVQPEGIFIANRHLPQGTSIAVCNHALHHNPTIFGPNHNTFDPSRWEEDTTASKSRILMHFGLGGRQCLGKTLATMNVYKLTATLLREFEFELADTSEREAVLRGEYQGRLPAMVSVGISDLEGPLIVTAKLRSSRKTNIPK